MSKLGNLSLAAIAAGILATATFALAQEQGIPADVPAPANAAPDQPQAAAPVQTSALAPNQINSIEVPAGTKVQLELRSAVNTKTANPGDGVYLSSSFPVVVNGRVAIPAGVYVQGVIDQVTRPGRVKGRASVRMHFTSMIFPNGTVVEIPGSVDRLPGSAGPDVKKEGEIEQAGSKGKDAGTILGAAATGAGLGSIGGAAAGRPGLGAGVGALGGAAGALIYTLFTRGNELALETGQSVEMVLQRPLTLTQANLGGGPNVAGQSNIVPTAQKPLPKPRILCPIGGLGCVE